MKLSSKHNLNEMGTSPTCHDCELSCSLPKLPQPAVCRLSEGKQVSFFFNSGMCNSEIPWNYNLASVLEIAKFQRSPRPHCMCPPAQIGRPCAPFHLLRLMTSNIYSYMQYTQAQLRTMWRVPANTNRHMRKHAQCSTNM